MGKKNLIHKIVATGIVFLFIIASVTPMVIGYTSDDVSNKNDEFLEKMIFMCNDERGINAKYEYYKEHLLNDYSTNDKSVEPVESSTVESSNGPMDSPWSMFGHDARHTGQSPYSTLDNPLTEKWRFENDGMIEDTPVISDDGTIYFGGAVDFRPYYLVALYPNGSLKWRYKTNGLI